MAQTPPPPPPSLSITPDVPETALAELVVLMVFMFISTVCVLMRVYSRFKKDRKLYFNDYAIVWAWIWAAGLVFDSLASILQGGTGHHITEILELAPERLPTMAKLFLAAQFTWALANAGVKISMIDLYIKIFGHNQTFRKVSYGMIGLTIAYCLAVILNAFFICRPLAFNWDMTIPGGSCGNQREAFLASGVVNLVLDLVVISMPLPSLWNLHLPLKRKFGLLFMFSIGFLICGITIWRMVTIQNLDFSDTFFQAGYLGITSCLEPLLGISNACLPVIQPAASMMSKPLSGLRSYFSNLLGSRNASSNASEAQSRESDRQGFQKLDRGFYPMTDFSGKPDATNAGYTKTNGDGGSSVSKSVDNIYATTDIKVESHRV